MAKDEFTCGPLDVAIIGMSGRFSGAESVPEWWDKLLAGEALTQPTCTADDSGNPWIRLRNMIADPYDFDAAFFNIPPGEALLMDPQQRVFLECCYNALEHAGYIPTQLKRVGVYGAAYANNYFIDRVYPYLKKSGDRRYLQAQIGNEKDYLCAQVAYKLGFTGPAVSVQTACSSSLVAAHLACEGLLAFQADVALAGGVTLGFLQADGYSPQGDKLVSQDGHCAPFSADATGTVYSSGAGVVVLKRLEDALRDRDRVYAVIKGGAVNNDGARRLGFVAPSVEGQVEVINTALAAAEVAPTDIALIETHGTGTPLGDEIELEALYRVFAPACAPHSIQLGAVKANLGHLGVASGIVSLMKTALTLHTGVVPSQINLVHKHKRLLQPSSPFYLSDLVTSVPQTKRIHAAVSSFGLGGTNAQLILQNWCETPAQAAQCNERRLFFFSAKTASALRQQLDVHHHALATYAEEDKDRVAYTLAQRRAHFPYRCALAAHSLAALCASLAERRHADMPFTPISAENTVVFLYPDRDDALESTMAYLLARQPDLCSRHQRLSHDVAQICVPADWTPALRQFIQQVSLSEWLIGQGISPAQHIGYQTGAAAAQYVARTLSLDNAVQQVIAAETTPGQMLADNSDLRETLANLALTAGTLMLEIGRAGTFSALYHQHAQWVGQTVFFPVLDTDTPEDVLPLLAALWQRGATVRLPEMHTAQTIGLPGYSFDRIRYEIQASETEESATLPVSYLSVSDFVEKTWRSLLCIDRYDEQTVIFEYGATSMHIISFVNSCNHIYKIGLSAADIYARPGIREHSEYISECVDDVL
ncbi:polyketide synthase [Serratia marcescens]|uniref:Polyketide synthase n=1 Tax=Serratia marcescens TaxID=615 RepID=A0A1Q4P011_SERMA|nr:colibactin polyketide synthase ClbO [Serratia marcescens]OKB66471.1 polyketide synthase [Serratia marcescens]